MKYDEMAVSEFPVLPKSGYPEAFLKAYEPLCCLATTPECETLYVEDRRTHSDALAKCYRVEGAQPEPSQESAILKALDHPALPHFLAEYQGEGYQCIVREYMEGTPLHLCALEEGFTPEQIGNVMGQLCDILTYLHSRKPPVIHRDIKPQNIILTDQGQVKLIDFGISRVYSPQAQTDTRHFGTEGFAPPEQYGFAQTDSRSDIYSLGIVLGWMLTGESAPQKAAQAIEGKALKRIYKKCTAFAPGSRYASAQQLKAALAKAQPLKSRGAGRLVLGVALSLAMAFAGFCMGRYTTLFSPEQAEPEALAVAFAEPILEQAARAQLGKGEADAITPEELLTITQLYVYGDIGVAATEEEYNGLKAQGLSKGPITSLADLEKMPNIIRLGINGQNILDISPLAGLPNLEFLDLGENPVSDISPLAGHVFLADLRVYATYVTDFSPLVSCPRLFHLLTGKVSLPSMEAFKGLEQLKVITLHGVTLDSLAGVEGFSQLLDFNAGTVRDGDLKPLLALPSLRRLLLENGMQQAAEAIADQADFSISFYD